MATASDGMLLVAKPPGPTSHDVVAAVRRSTAQRRVGHAGTLDPMASGLLPMVLGRATRLVRFLPHSPKTYRGILQLGLTTSTDDVTGEVLRRHSGPLPGDVEVVAAARAMTGRRLQTPPAFSARKVEGQRLYRLAREGIRVEAPPAEIEVDRFELTPTPESAFYEFLVEVSGGTYVRALVRDLGQTLGCGGALAALSRTRIGPMSLEDALDWAADRPPDRKRILDALIPLEGMPLEPPVFRLADPLLAGRFVSGQAIPVTDGPPRQGLFRVLHPSGALLGIAESRGGLMQPRVVLAPGRLPESSTAPRSTSV